APVTSARLRRLSVIGEMVLSLAPIQLCNGECNSVERREMACRPSHGPRVILPGRSLADRPTMPRTFAALSLLLLALGTAGPRAQIRSAVVERGGTLPQLFPADNWWNQDIAAAPV